MKMLRTTLRTTAALVLVSALAGPALSSRPFLDDEDEKDEEEAKEDEERWFALVGGDVYTGTGSVLRGATILAKNGVIEDEAVAAG